MRLKALLSAWFLFLIITISYAQTSVNQKAVKMYRDGVGKLYTVAQKDSIRDLGYPISTSGNGTTIGDTTFIDFKIMPQKSDFVLKYENKELPSFSLKTLDGKIIDLNSLKGKVVMVNFWSTTCNPCIFEMPELNKLKEMYKDVVFLAPAPENPTKIKKLLTKHPFEFLILPNAQELFDKWGIESYPINFFVDKEGIIRVVKEGTPILNERDEKGQVQIALIQSYAPILDYLTKQE
ncbi:TlpA disulfide reductase family protein [uncultured Pontibacter sp.]|uniref:TlpA family protein disulfide reductase n=1 Tax=uncultured Pontibacter sp. TaxID=453356 RepID=UPI0026079056|nr:TlpA disulfide reductase family protein [uncultured Pontibacter sp.]